MNQNRLIAIVILIVIALVAVNSTFYTVDQREKAIVIRFGEVIRADEDPGLHIKIPIIHKVRYFDARILTMDAEPRPFLTVEKKNVEVDSFVKWRIHNPLQYYLRVGGSEAGARTRLEQLINSGLRDEFGKRSVRDVVSGDRREIMRILTTNTDKEAREYGIQVVDVRIQRVDLPAEVSQSVYRRMEAERKRIASELRAEGSEAAEKIRADAERQREVLLAEAYRESEKIRGDGDARATATYANAYQQSPEFYSFYRSLNAYKESFKGKDDILIVDPSSEFFKYLKKSGR
jgi:modulator of FtsH protease HflC